MASTELDPLFVKGLRLLHSKSKDSTEQLKQLLDDVIAQTKQGTHPKDRLYTSIKVDGESKIHIKKASREISDYSTYSSKYSSDDIRERKAEKRQLEKSKQESIEVEAKIPKLEPPQVYPYYPSSPDLPKLDQYVSKKEDDTDSSEENADADDFAMEMGLACVICKQLDVTQGNQLIECQECHSLYHQECHRPPATDYDYNDPRRVWYCAKCVKNMKKMATKTQKSVKSSVSISAKEPVSTAKSTRSEINPPAAVLPFKRSELKQSISSQGNNQSSTNKPIGLAGLAANFGGRAASSSAATSLAPTTRGSKSAAATLNLKPPTPFSSAATTTKTSSLTNTSNLSSKTTSAASSFQNASTSSATSIAASSTQKQATTTTAVKGLGLLSVAAAASAATRSAANAAAPAAAGGNGNSGHKVPSCSPLMSADKRLQIMKKKASKMHEKRRLSNK